MNVEAPLSHSKHIIPLEYKGEPGLTLGIALNDTLERYSGIINFGPFGCMPTRIAEATTKPEMKVRCKNNVKQRINPKWIPNKNFTDDYDIPFLTIESDGYPFSQLIEARLETFLLQVKRADRIMQRRK
jgi:hypothetical protein